MKASDTILDIVLEDFTAALYAEMEEMVVDHAEDTDNLCGSLPEPDIEIHLKMQEMGILKFFTLRDKGKLVGYIFYSVMPNIQFKRVVVASQMGLFVDREYRRTLGAFSLISDSEYILKTFGINAIIQHTNIKHDIGRLYESKGYELYDKCYIKVIEEVGRCHSEQ